MTLYKTALRQILRSFALTRLPGRYILVEVLRPFVVQNTRVVAKAYDDLVFELDLNDLIQRQIFFELSDRDDIDFLSQFLRMCLLFTET